MAAILAFIACSNDVADATAERDLVATAAERAEDPLVNWTRPLREDCPICMPPLPLSNNELWPSLCAELHTYKSCCGKTICGGCAVDQFGADKKDGKSFDEGKARICPFCRADTLTLKFYEQERKLANAGHHKAMWIIGSKHFQGEYGIGENKAEGIKCFHYAAEAGSPEAATALGNCYMKGDGVEQDIDKALK